MAGDSLFYVKKPGRGNWFWGVTKNDLNGNWRAVFGGNYNIANSVVANAIKNDQLWGARGGSARGEYGPRDLRRGDVSLT
jgi:hypothetical protein